MTLPCIVCGKDLESALPADLEGGQNQPNDGTTFISHGQYGSTVWDPMDRGGNEMLEINICDPCLLQHKDKVLHVTRITTTDHRIRPWEPT